MGLHGCLLQTFARADRQAPGKHKGGRNEHKEVIMTGQLAAAALIRKFYETADASVQPASDLGPFFADGFNDHNRPATAPANLTDKQVILNLFQELKTGFPDARHALDIVSDIDENLAMVYWTFSGTQSGPFFGAPASNKRVRINGVDIFRAQDGKFIEQWHVEELMSLFAQIAPEK
jgi:predicted ester cyclase